jgi:hypothetical protein
VAFSAWLGAAFLLLLGLGTRRERRIGMRNADRGLRNGGRAARADARDASGTPSRTTSQNTPHSALRILRSAFRIPHSAFRNLKSDACGPQEKELLPLLALGLTGLCAALQLRAIFHLPIDARFADMLPLIRSALDSLGSGRPAYQTYSFPWPLPLTFLPGLWLSYLPAWLGGADLRLLGLVAGVLLLGRLASLSTRTGGLGAWLVLLLLATGPKFTDFARIGHLAVYWLVLVLFAEAWLAGSRRAALGLGLLLAMRQTAWLLLPPLALHLFRTRADPGGRPAVLGPALGLAGLLILPFLLQAPAAFVHGTVEWYTTLGSRVYAFEPLSVLGQPGLGGLLHAHGLAWLLPGLALGGLLACWLLGPCGPSGALGSGALGLAAFSLFSAPCWWYSLLDPILLLAVAQAAPEPGRRETLWRRRALASGVLASAAWLGLSRPHVEALHFDPDSARYLVQGVYGVERWGPRTIAWTGAPQAVIALPRLSPFSGELLLVLRPSPRLAGPLQIELNGTPLREVRPAPGWAAYRLRLGRGRLVLGNNSLVLRGSAAERSEADPRPLMAALDELLLLEAGAPGPRPPAPR